MIEKIFFWGLASVSMAIFYVEPGPLPLTLAAGFILFERIFLAKDNHLDEARE